MKKFLSLFIVSIAIHVQAQISLPAYQSIQNSTSSVSSCALSDTTITIGTQTWMAKNLEVTTFRDGIPIPEATTPTAWKNTTAPAWCYPNFDPVNGPIYGKIYNRFVIQSVSGHAGIGPSGYHIPTDTNWTTLTDYLGGTTVAGGKMKETGNIHWNSNTAATNSSCFSARAGGSVGKNGAVLQYLGTSFFCTDVAGNSKHITNSSGSISSATTVNNNGYSIRLIHD